MSAQMVELEDIARQDSKDQVDTDAVPAGESSEYVEYQALSQHFQGDVLSKLTRRTDWRVLPPLIVAYMFTYIDRGNIGNARLFGAQEDLKMNGTDWNIGLSLIFVTFGLCSPFTNIPVKKYTAKRVLPIMFFGCGVTIIGAGCCSTKGQWYTLRLLLGVFEPGIFNGCVYLMTTYYGAAEIVPRSYYFYLGATLSGACSGLLAYGIGALDYHWGFRGWRWIYVLEGFISCILAILSYFWIPCDPDQGPGWLTEQERRFLILRNKFSYGDDKSGNSLGFNYKDYMSAFVCPHVWILGISWFTTSAAVFGYAFTLPTIIANMGFTAVTAQALTVPPYIIAFISCWVMGLLSSRFTSFTWNMIVLALISFVGLLICFVTAGRDNLIALTYVGCMISAVGFYPLTPVFTAWYSVQIAGSTKRAAGLSFSGIFCVVGGIAGSYIYLSKEAPKYPLGFGLSFALILAGNVVLIACYSLWVRRINARRAAMSEEEIKAKYTPEQLEAMGDRSPYYVYSR